MRNISGKTFLTWFKLVPREKEAPLWALAVWLGMALGFSPTFLTPQAFLFLFMIILFRIPLAVLLLSLVFSSLLGALALDPVFHHLGRWILQGDFLRPLWTFLFHLPLIPFTRFNNTVLLGAGVVTLLAMPAVFYLGKFLEKRGRA